MASASCADDTGVIWTQLPRGRRTAVISAALALFLIGSNYCLIGALRGTPMACTTIAGAVPAKSAPAPPMCPLHATKSGTAKGSNSNVPGSAPCCVTLARAEAPDAPRIDTFSMPVDVLALIAASPAISADPPALPSVFTEEHPPAPAWQNSAHAGRAPPALA